MVTALRLHTRDARKKLPPRDKAYFLELRRGLAIGYRRGTDGASWLLREYRGKKYVQRRLGAADDDLPSDGSAVLSWDEAQRIALAEERPTITRPTKLTVREAAMDYFHTRQGRGDVERDRITYRAFIEKPLGERPINELTSGHFETWLANQVPKTDDKDVRRAAQATANRRWTILRAILNSAYRRDDVRVPSADAWRRIRPFQRVDRPRLRSLSTDEVRAVLKALDAVYRPLATGAIYTGCRLGELLALKVSDVGVNYVRIENAKAGKHRTIPLSAEAVGFFAKLVKRRSADALVFGLEDTKNLRVDICRKRKAACLAAKIAPATFHDLRRSYGSIMLNSGASIDAIQDLLGHSDPRMTRRAYAHLLQDTLRKSVEAHAPSLKVRRNRAKADIEK